MDELWQVAKGQKKYAEFAEQRKDGKPREQPSQPRKDVELPDDVVSPAFQTRMLCSPGLVAIRLRAATVSVPSTLSRLPCRRSA